MTISTELSTFHTAENGRRGDPAPSERPGYDDRGIELARPIPLGFGFAPGTRMRFEYPGERFEPFLRLALTEPTGPTFWVVEPGRLFEDYIVAIPEADVDLLGLIDQSDVLVFVIVSPGEETPTVNLFAPVVINRRTRRGAQVILEDSGYLCAVPVDAETARPRGLVRA